MITFFGYRLILFVLLQFWKNCIEGEGCGNMTIYYSDGEFWCKKIMSKVQTKIVFQVVSIYK